MNRGGIGFVGLVLLLFFAFFASVASGCRDCTQRPRGGPAEWTKAGLAGADIIGSIAVDPRDPKTVYVAVAAGSTDKGFLRTKDGGASWKKLAGGLPDTHAQYVAVSPRDGAVLVNPGVEGIWRSTNGGETFVRVATDPGGTSGFFFHPTTNVVWTLTSQKGVWRSPDGGQTWAHMASTNLPLNRFTLGPMASDGTHLYLASGGNGVWISNDEGSTWTKAASTNLPVTSAGGDMLAIATPQPGVVIVQTTFGGVFRSNDSAATFTKLSPATRRSALAFDPRSRETTFVVSAEEGGLFQTRDGGATFVNVGPRGITIECAAVASDGTVYAGTVGQGVYRL